MDEEIKKKGKRKQKYKRRKKIDYTANYDTEHMRREGKTVNGRTVIYLKKDSRFGKLTIIGPDDERNEKGGKATVRNCIYYLCQCDCGKVVSQSKYLLLYHNVRSCGCLKIDENGKYLIRGVTKHGCAYKRIYQQYIDMLLRYGHVKGAIIEQWQKNFVTDEHDHRINTGFNNFKAWFEEQGWTPECDDTFAFGRNSRKLPYMPDNCWFDPNGLHYKYPKETEDGYHAVHVMLGESLYHFLRRVGVDPKVFKTHYRRVKDWGWTFRQTVSVPDGHGKTDREAWEAYFAEKEIF